MNAVHFSHLGRLPGTPGQTTGCLPTYIPILFIHRKSGNRERRAAFLPMYRMQGTPAA
jgi:hypothetical protein